MSLTREALRAKIDALEALSDVTGAIDDVGGVDWEPGEAESLDLSITTHTASLAVAFVHSIPPAVVLAGLRAMQAELERMAAVAEVV